LIKRQQRAVRELERFTQRLIRVAERTRGDPFWSKIQPGAQWETVKKTRRTQLWEEVIGKLPDPSLPPNPQTRVVRETPKWSATK
jgi:hypothetical protein